MQQTSNKTWKYGFSSRTDGDLRNARLRRAFLNSHGFTPGHLVQAEQVHGSLVAPVTSAHGGRVIDGADALVGKAAPSLVMGVRIADCVPLILWDESAMVAGVVHAGWRGTLGEIASKAVLAMKRLGADPARIHAVIGPHIHACCYHVREDRARAFQGQFPKAVHQTNGKHSLSLGEANREQLIRAGISPHAMTISSVCTSCSVDEYFSYRADSQDTFGEQLAWIGV